MSFAGFVKLARPATPMKNKYWRAVRPVYALKAAPVLDFTPENPVTSANPERGSI
jgi:hypothetical protein